MRNLLRKIGRIALNADDGGYIYVLKKTYEYGEWQLNQILRVH